MLVLCVDDDDMVRLVTGNMLRELGHEVIEAQDGESALDRLRDCGRHVDLMMTDIRMPGMTGFLLARRAKVHNPKLNVVFMTGYIDGPMPPGPHFSKPCTLRRLEETISSAIRSH